MSDHNVSVCCDDFLVLFGSFVLHVISFGMIKSFGVLYTALVEHFHSSRGDAGWIASLGAGVALLFGPFAGILEERQGCSFVALLGSIFIGTGLAISSLVENIYLLYLTYGIITGIGFSLCHVAASVSVNIHFDVRRVTAVAITNTGSGIGTMVLPILGSYLIEKYGWQGTFLLLSGVGLQGTYCGIMFKRMRTKKSTNDRNTSKPNCNSESTIQKEISEGDERRGQENTILKMTKAIFSTRKYIIFTISVFCVGMAFFIPYTMLPDMVTEQGVSDDDAALMITVVGISSILSRITLGPLSDFSCCNRLMINGISLITLGVSTSLCVLFNDEYLFFIYTIILGVVTGLFGIYLSVIVVDIVGKTNLSLAYGYLICIEGVAVVIGPPLAGFLYDVRKNYNLSFICCGVLFGVGGVLSIVAGAGKKETSV